MLLELTQFMSKNIANFMQIFPNLINCQNYWCIDQFIVLSLYIEKKRKSSESVSLQHKRRRITIVERFSGEINSRTAVSKLIYLEMLIKTRNRLEMF